MPKNNEKNVPETKVASGTKTETTEVRGVDGSEIKGGPTTSDGTEGRTTETIATDVQTGKGSTMIGIAPNATTPTLLDERSATAVKRLAPKGAAVVVMDSSVATTGEAVSNAVTTVETAGIEATNETTAPEAGVSRTEISTRTIGPVLRATTQISRSEPPATDARHPARAVVAVVAGTTVAVAAEAAVAATTEATVVATAVPSNETIAPTAVTVGLSEETTVAAQVAFSPATTGARLRTDRTDAQEENARVTPTINLPETSGTTRRENLTENETSEAVP